MSLPNLNLPEPPIDPEESIVLGILDDYLHNGGKVPPDATIIQRVTLGAVREVYRSSASNSNNLRRLWGAVALLAAGLVSYIFVTAATHDAIWRSIESLELLLRNHIH